MSENVTVFSTTLEMDKRKVSIGEVKVVMSEEMGQVKYVLTKYNLSFLHVILLQMVFLSHTSHPCPEL